MKGKWIYFTVASLMGILTSLLNGMIFLALIFLILFLYKKKNFTKRQLVTISMIFIVFFIRTELKEKSNHSDIPYNKTNFFISLQENIKVDGDKFTATAKEINYKEKLIVTYKIKTENEKKLIEKSFKTGMACKLTGSLEEPFTATNINAFNYKEYLHRNQTFWILKAEQVQPSNCIPQKKTPLSLIRTIRENGIEYVKNHFPKETAPLAIALLFGDRNFIEEDVINAYQKLGIVHLLAISGLHVGMLAGLIYFIGIRAGVTREKMTSALLMFLPFYAIITGASPSVIRAVFMMMIFLALQKWGKRLSLVTADVLGIVFIIYTFFSPYIIYNVGFQLSFGVSLSLILSAPIILKRFSHPISILFATSLICQLAATPIMFYYFYEVSLISVLANILFVPLFSMLILPAVFIIFLLHLLFQGHIQLPVTILNVIIFWMDQIAGRFAQIPFAMITLGRPPTVVLILYLICLLCYFSLWEKVKGIRKMLKLQGIPLILLFIHGSSLFLSPYGEITFIDVGQGDSIFIKLPHGKGNYLIDTGGTLLFNNEDWQIRRSQYDVGKDVVVPFLKSKGITTIDKLILTHGDADHIGGAAEVLQEIKVKEMILPISENLSELEKNLLQTANKKKIPFRFTMAGDGWKAGGIIFQVLSPQDKTEKDRNNGSVVLNAKIGGLTWLFTGDLEESGEEKLINRYQNLKIDVLKVGHHGSKSSTSPAFLDRISPKLAVVSAGKNNRYGHPNKEVLKNLSERNINVLRTDQHGGITYYFKGNHGTFSVMVP
ncbi:DNA internalization-related competence protein ComEC/Rec2 [Cytobacillus depressus]|uniref:DNA internalization-related competence protein ComEC/Rec2 n=1 Tax=Cytobacillus depressus TaxID=1602942 RepID=A0A6L3VAI4_9BACI|nr:DNA internalization-related competence protein ComEC/Rec2 [Cytobacillus depressus]KAB2338620.1 DNA internalization-related competence protein ComEC/Rec2 [Cytobacillus depressus]